MRSVINCILSLSLLTLAIGCAKKPELKVSLLDQSGLINLVKQSEKPYVVVNFYTMDCKPCVKEIPELVELQIEEEDELAVHFVSVDQGPEWKKELKEFSQKLNVGFSLFHCEPNEIETLLNNFNLKHIHDYPPLTFIFDKSGRLVEAMGITDSHEINMIIHQDQSFRN